MITSNAPDPRDIIWANMCMDYQTIELRENLIQFVLLIGLACWGYVVTLITSLSNVLFINENVGGFLIRVGLTQGVSSENNRFKSLCDSNLCLTFIILCIVFACTAHILSPALATSNLSVDGPQGHSV